MAHARIGAVGLAADLYQGVTTSGASATTSLASASVMVAVSDQAQPRRRLVHLVNHDYTGGLVEQDGVVVSVPLPSAPSAVTLASPDMAQDMSVPFTYTGGSVSVTLPTLVAYDAIAIAY
jgi:hypothetical protein